MGALTFDALLRSLKQGAPDPVYYLHGEEDVLKDEAVRVLLERAVDPAARDFNVDQRTAADLDPEAFNALVNTPPILAATRAVVLRGMEQPVIGAGVGLGGRRGPVQWTDLRGTASAGELPAGYAGRWDVLVRASMARQRGAGPYFVFRLERSEVVGGVGTLPIARPET